MFSLATQHGRHLFVLCAYIYMLIAVSGRRACAYIYAHRAQRVKHLLCSIFTAVLVPYYPLELKILFMATCRDREEQESAAASQPPMKELNPTASHSSTVDVLAICGGKKCQECSGEGFLACLHARVAEVKQYVHVVYVCLLSRGLV